TTNNTAYYYTFVVQSTAGTVDFRYTTVNQVGGGIFVTGGTNVTRYFDHVTVTHANGFGFRLVDSSATLTDIYVGVDFLPVRTRTPNANCGSNTTYNYTSTGYYYGYTYIYNCYYDYWSAGGTGVSVLRGSPYFDGIEVHTPNLNTRIDIALHGGYLGFY